MRLFVEYDLALVGSRDISKFEVKENGSLEKSEKTVESQNIPGS